MSGFLQLCIVFNAVLNTVIDFSFQCFDTVGLVMGRHLACKKLGVGLLVVTI